MATEQVLHWLSLAVERELLLFAAFWFMAIGAARRVRRSMLGWLWLQASPAACASRSLLAMPKRPSLSG
jgi:hypothetical protein